MFILCYFLSLFLFDNAKLRRFSSDSKNNRGFFFYLCMDKNGIFGQIVETGPKTVRMGSSLTDVELVFSSFANLLEKKLYICKRETYKEE